MLKANIEKHLSAIRLDLERLSRNSMLARFAYNCFMAWGMDSRARYIKRTARTYGLMVRWRQAGVFISSDANTLILRNNDDVAGVCRFFEDYIGKEGDDVETASIRDLRVPFRQMSRETGGPIWFSSVPETIQTSRGYLAKGPPRPGEIVFDIGAYCGEIAMVFSRLAGSEGRVFVFEPDDRNFDVLKRNITEQRLENVIAIRRGVAGKSGTLGFYHSGGLASQLIETRGGTGEVIEVLSFVDACAMAKCEPDFVKMDVEGAEVDIIRAALPALARSKTRFAIASYHVVDGQPTSVALEEMFRSIGYEVETGNPEHQTTWAWRAE